MSIHKDAERQEIRLCKRPVEDESALQRKHGDYASTSYFVSLSIMYSKQGMLING
jgi:hypothetical protein